MNDHLLTEARFLLARVSTDTPPRREEIDGLRARLSAMRAHPSCAPTRGEQIGGALLILDVLALTREPASTVLVG
jgi:hypothetical protein